MGQQGTRFRFQNSEERVRADDGFQLDLIFSRQLAAGMFIGQTVVARLRFFVGPNFDKRAGEVRRHFAGERSEQLAVFMRAASLRAN